MNANAGDFIEPDLRLVAWEVTRRCNLACAHCRASSEDADYAGELGTDECLRLIDDIAQLGRPILILTGGEPLCRADVFDIARYAVEHGFRVVLGTNGTLITGEVAAELRRVPVSRVGVSIDFPTSESQDGFRGKAGAFEAALAGIRQAQRAGIEVQINSTVTRMNERHLDELLSLALEVGAVAFHPFLLVPTGRGKALSGVELSAAEHERVLNWIYDRQSQFKGRISFKPTDAPHYMRIALQRSRDESANPDGQFDDLPGFDSITRGCLAGTGFCFISHVGRVQGCGYLDVEAGNVRQQSFNDIWHGSALFNQLRDLQNLKGKCGACEYRRPCGGCRARAYEATGDYLAEEPYCVYTPAAMRRDTAVKQTEMRE